MHIEYSAIGRKIAEVPMCNGKKHGLCICWSDDGIIIAKIDYLNGQIHGKYLVYFSNGQKHLEIDYTAGKKNGWYREWLHNGHISKEMQYEYDIRHGAYHDYEKNKLFISANYYNGKLHGEYREYHSDEGNGSGLVGVSHGGLVGVNGGGPKLHKIINYKDGQRHGIYTVYFANGNKCYELEYCEDRAQSPITFWREDGTLDRTINSTTHGLTNNEL